MQTVLKKVSTHFRHMYSINVTYKKFSNRINLLQNTTKKENKMILVLHFPVVHFRRTHLDWRATTAAATGGEGR